MSTSSRGGHIAPPRFGVAVHVLVWLARSEGVSASAEIASQVQSHSTFLRRVLAPLVQAGIVEAREGRVGGYLLGRSADTITLGDIYTACNAVGLQAADGPDGDPDCGTTGEQLDSALGAILDQADDLVIEFLSRHTLADLARKVEV